MQSKGTLGSIIAGVIAIFLVLVCLFYLSFTMVQNHHESKAEEYALAKVGSEEQNPEGFMQAKRHYLDSISLKPVWLGYTYNEVQKWGIGLGLDLKGGMSVTLQVSMPDLLKSMKNGEIDESFKQALAFTDSVRSKDANADYLTVFVEKYRELEPNANMAMVFNGIDIKDNETNTGAIVSVLRQEVKDRVDNSATNVLRKRIDAYGVVSPNIQVLQGKDGQILLELPGVKDHDHMLGILKKQANLQFFKTHQNNFGKIVGGAVADLDKQTEGAFSELAYQLNYKVDDRGRGTDEVESATKGYRLSDPVVAHFAISDTAKVNAIVRNNHVPGDIALRWAHKPEVCGETRYLALYALQLTNGEAAMDGSHIVSARADFNSQTNTNEVSMTMDSDGARQWAQVTGESVGHPVAIVLDDEVYSAPNVNDKITGGNSQITGHFTVQEAQDLANVLKSGKMTAGVDVVQYEVIGPSLGKQAIESGIVSFIVALLLLMVVMMCYYGAIPGLVANFGLFCNLFFTFGILSSFQAVLTLSGIAGIVLALGMAVDANVLIFERAKEELRAGKNARTAIADGYSNAFSAIFDSNLTSIITGVILLLYGTGPIKGFATTLIIGIVCSFFTGVYLTRIIFILGAKKKAFERLTFTTAISRKLFSGSSINFLGKSKVSFIIVGIIIAIVGVSFATRGLNQGIDFSGGRNYVITFNQPVDAHEIQQSLAPAFEGAQVAVINIEGKNQVRVSTNYRINETGTEVDDQIVEILYDSFKAMNLLDLKEHVEVAEEAAPAAVEATEATAAAADTNAIAVAETEATEVVETEVAEVANVEPAEVPVNDELTQREKELKMFSTTDQTQGIVSSQKVGPTVAADMRTDAIIAVILSLLAMFLYILLRFRNIAFSVGALAAVAFTAFAIIGLYSLCYGVLPFAMEIDQTFIAAILTVIGYQINDTVVVFDRVRENTVLFPKKNFLDVVNSSINSTLGRTIMTSGTTLLVLLCIFFLGGESLRSFVFAMMIGVIVGTLATIFIASPVAYLIGRGKTKF